MAELLVIIEGGIITDIFSDDPDVEVLVDDRDLDEIWEADVVVDPEMVYNYLDE